MASAQGNEKEITRREFIKGSAAGGAGGLVIGAGGAALIMQSMPGPGLPGKWDHEAEVVVVGTGYAGINAAIAAHDAGAKVLVLEKAPEKFAGGNSSVSGGGMRIPLKVPETVDYYRSLCFGTVPDELCGTMVDALSSVPEQLKKLGIEVAPIRSYARSPSSPPPTFPSSGIGTRQPIRHRAPGREERKNGLRSSALPGAQNLHGRQKNQSHV